MGEGPGGASSTASTLSAFPSSMTGPHHDDPAGSIEIVLYRNARRAVVDLDPRDILRIDEAVDKRRAHFGRTCGSLVNHLSEKAGLGKWGWCDPGATFQVFEAQVFGERD